MSRVASGAVGNELHMFSLLAIRERERLPTKRVQYNSSMIEMIKERESKKRKEKKRQKIWERME